MRSADCYTNIATPSPYPPLELSTEQALEGPITGENSFGISALILFLRYFSLTFDNEIELLSDSFRQILSKHTYFN